MTTSASNDYIFLFGNVVAKMFVVKCSFQPTPERKKTNRTISSLVWLHHFHNIFTTFVHVVIAVGFVPFLCIHIRIRIRQYSHLSQLFCLIYSSDKFVEFGYESNVLYVETLQIFAIKIKTIWMNSHFEFHTTNMIIRMIPFVSSFNGFVRLPFSFHLFCRTKNVC